MNAISTRGTAPNQNVTRKEMANKTLHKYKEDKIIFHTHSKQLQMQYLLSKYHIFAFINNQTEFKSADRALLKD